MGVESVPVSYRSRVARVLSSVSSESEKYCSLSDLCPKLSLLALMLRNDIDVIAGGRGREWPRMKLGQPGKRRNVPKWPRH